MKVRITQTVNIDADAWAYEFGLDPEEVRDDVKAYFNNWLQQQVENLGLDAAVQYPDIADY